MGKAVSAVKSQRKMISRAARFAEKVVEICNAKGFRLINVYVVGSRAREDYLEDSDIDLVFIIEGIDHLNQVERKLMFKEVLEAGIDFIILSPKEWLSSSPVIKMLRKEAIPLDKLIHEL
jgi:predicted nucleotidyltransferase